jgi:hypothetical protein
MYNSGMPKNKVKHPNALKKFLLTVKDFFLPLRVEQRWPRLEHDMKDNPLNNPAIYALTHYGQQPHDDEERHRRNMEAIELIEA